MAFLACVALVVSARAEPVLQAAAERLGPGQGVYVRAADGTVLASHEADRRMHPASVTKIATTLALLRRLGPAHRFETRIVAGGTLRDGTLAGDLLVEGGGDPFFVTENALLVLSVLEARGLRTVDGAVRVRGPFLFNWRPDPDGRRVARVLAGVEIAEAWEATRAARPDAAGPRPAGLRFLERRNSASADGTALAVTHRSPALVTLLKSLNCYSNNVFHLLSDRIGGPAAVEEAARAAVAPELRPAILIDDAAGLGTTNRMSAQAAVALVDALAADLAREELTLAHVLPVAGRDPGTLQRRLAGGAVVGKTGTIGSLTVSALAGRVRTRRWGEVTFAIFDHGMPVDRAQQRQDAFVRSLMDAGDAVSWPAAGALASIAESELEIAR